MYYFHLINLIGAPVHENYNFLHLFLTLFSDLDSTNIEAALKAKLAESQEVHFYGSGK
jgi:hypothetical protein